MGELTRKDFLKAIAAAGAGLAVFGAAGCGGTKVAISAPTRPPLPTALPASDAYLAAVHGLDPATITEKAVEAIGGMKRFVREGADVIVKPNICVDYHSPEYAATTNPTVVATLVSLCLAAGAARVRVMDTPFGGTPESAYAKSGIGPAVQTAGGEMVVMSPVRYATYKIPRGKSISSWSVYRDVLETDVLIDVPIAKQHDLAGLTLGGKNLLGVIESPGSMHMDIGQRVADLISLIRPNLTVVDAVRILLRNGPTGGNLADVTQTNTVIASHDIVAADAFAATLFGQTGADVSYVVAAHAMGLGEIDLKKLKIRLIEA
jgi:uncharacterized protein (DUF362 family)